MPRSKAFDPDEVLDRAVELFWRRGYAATSMAALLATMGISRQSLYDTYGDKHTLYLRALDRYRDQLHREFERCLSAGDSPVAGVRAFVDHVEQNVVGEAARRSCMLANAAIELGQHDPEVRERVADHLARVDAGLRRALSRAAERGELGEGRDPVALAGLLTLALHGLGVLARGGVPPPTVRASLDAALALLD